MNPYLENPELWSEFHSWMIVAIADALNIYPSPYSRVQGWGMVINSEL
jgi:rhamnogalacturonyl hydrolase YesR